ncbi:MAG: thiamine diphosphokinase [Chloroflexota bacterium]|nr:thiamine diphosphokinase [Chloroflexota bacterium]
MQAIVIAFVEDILSAGRLKHYAQETERQGGLVICADSGGEAALSWGLHPHLLIGDMDSIRTETLAELSTQPNLEIRQMPVEKDETDLELALYAALDRGANEITILGGLGGRLDHTLGNLYLLATPRLDQPEVRARLLGEREEVFLLRGGQQFQVEGQPGELLSLIPLAGDAQGVRTGNLYYPLKGETLFIGPTRGISNLFTSTPAEISLEAGLLIVIHTFGPKDKPN